MIQNDRILRWKPFLFRCTNYEGRKICITFTCPLCGGHNCEKIGDLDLYNFWSGHYKCKDCGCATDNGNPINYYSDCFVVENEKRDAVQLELF